MINKKQIQQVIIAVLFLCINTSFAFAKMNDGIIAVVNDEIITMKDFRDYLSAVYMNLSSSGQTREQIKETMTYYQANGLDKLINDKLMIDHAKEIQLTIRPEVIEKRVQEIRDRYPTETEFLADIVSQGFTLTDLYRKVEDQFKVRYVEEIAIRSKVFVSPQDVSEFYQKNIPKFEKPESVLLDSIFIPYNDDPELAEKKAAEAIKILNDPELLKGYENNFEGVAKKFSDSPSIGTIHKGEAMPAIEEIVFKLKAGEISGITKVDTGIYIFKLKEKFPKTTASLEEVKDYIYNILFQKQLNEKREAWLKKARKQAYIDIKK